MNCEFRPIRSGNFKGFVVRDWPIESFQTLLKKPDATIDRPENEVLKQSASCLVVAMTPLKNGERDT
ncbi:MAG: hypothetical protein U0798_15530 [Gemmataceae bacterium]